MWRREGQKGNVVELGPVAWRGVGVELDEAGSWAWGGVREDEDAEVVGEFGKEWEGSGGPVGGVEEV